MKRTWTLVVLAVFVAPFAASAQQAAPPIRDRASITFDEVERGFHFGLAGGPLFWNNPPPGTLPFLSAGQEIRLEMGFDLGSYVSFGVFGMLTTNRAPAAYIGKSQGSASGDFASIIPGALIKISPIGFRDGQDIKRVWLYLRAGGGYAMFYPRALLPDADVMIFAGPGVEYFTRLRHFSVGLEATFNMLVNQQTIGFAVTPTLRYAF
jgi:hypothetical protein